MSEEVSITKANPPSDRRGKSGANDWSSICAALRENTGEWFEIAPLRGSKNSKHLSSLLYAAGRTVVETRTRGGVLYARWTGLKQ